MQNSTPSFSLQRQSFLDALRGFAIFGIILVNISVFSSPYYGSGVRDLLMQSHADYLVSFLVSVLFETKFYLLFSFLFGYSFTIQMESAKQKSQKFTNSFMRRLLGLFLIGTLHALFFYHGDILTTYALMGLVLFFLRHKQDQTFILIAITLIIITALCWSLVALETDNAPLDPQMIALALEPKKQQFLGNFYTIIQQHSREWQATIPITIAMQAPTALAMFCLGFIAGKRQLFLNFKSYQKTAHRLCLLGLMIGLPSAIIYGYATTFNHHPQLELLTFSLSILTAPLLCISYIVLAFKFYQTHMGQKLSPIFIPVGKMALSNYLLQSILCSFLFFGIGFGLMGTTSPTVTLLIAVTIFILQCFFSHYWLKFFKFGPLEKVLRAFTKGQW